MRPEDAVLGIVILMAALALGDLVIDRLLDTKQHRDARRRNADRYVVADWKPWWK